VPRVLPRPTFKPDEIVHAIEPFAGSHNDESFVCNPEAAYRGDHPLVRKFPHMFARQGDVEARAAYYAAVNAQNAAYRAEQEAEERKRREALHKRATALADELEAKERERRKRAGDHE